MSCPICLYSGSDFKKYQTVCTLPVWCRGETLVRFQCPQCDVIFGPLDMLALSPNKLCEMYRRHYDGFKEAREARSKTYGLLGINDVVTAGQTVLNWGSGPAAGASPIARDKLGVQLFNYDPFGHENYDIITDEHKLSIYDGITSVDVIEHLQDPVGEFLKMKKHLSSNGKMVHITDCYRYHVIFTKYHLFFFVGRSVGILGQRSGFVPIKKGNNKYIFTQNS